MKKIIFAFILFLVSFLSSFGQTTIWSEDFSTSSNYSVTLGGEGNDGTSDYFQRTDGSNIGVSYSGNTNDFFAGQDINDGGWTGSASPSELTWSNINISGYSSLSFEGLFASAATAKIDEPDYVKIEIDIDGGGWTTILEFENDGSTYNTEFGEDTDFDGDSDGSDLTSTFANFTKNISGTGSSMDLRITVAIDAGGEDFAFDEFYIKGSATSCSEPTTQATAITFSSVDYTSMTVDWTSGNGSNRVVIINTSNSFTAPSDGTDPSANSTYGGSGEQVIYNGNGSSVDVDGLSTGTTYYFHVYEYNCSGSNTIYNTNDDTNNPNSQSTLTCSEPTSESSSISFSSVQSSSMTVSWTSGNGENRIVVIHEGSAVSSNPSDNSTYSANSSYGSGDDIGTNEFVVYNGNGTSVNVTGLSSSTTYYFEIFEYNCNTNSEDYLTSSTLTGSQATSVAPVAAVLEQGDIVVVGVCSNIKACVQYHVNGTDTTQSGDDEISFVCFKDITTGTIIEMTDNGWEKCNSNEWGNSEGYIKIKRTGGTITAGTVITIRMYQKYDKYECIYPDNDWSIEDTHGSLILNSSGDQVYFMQGGTWDNGSSGNNDATYTGGEILFAFNTNDSWTSGICSTSNSSSGNGRSQNSGLISGMDCFNMVPSGATDYLKYTGPSTQATQIEWIGRINDNTNWSSYADCATYYSSSPDYTNGDTLDIISTGIDVTYNWYGNKSTEWFECANWGPLKIPTASNNVVIPNSTQVDTNIILVAGENAECKNFTVQDTIYTIKGENGSTKVLTVNGNLTLDGGSIDFDDSNDATTDGTIYVKGNWINNYDTDSFACGNSTVIFNGNTTQTITSNSGTENFGSVQITGSTVLNLNNNDITICNNWTNYSQEGLTEGTSTVSFNGTTNQSINTTGGEIFYNFVTDNAVSVTLSSNLTVSNQLNQLQGELILNGKTITLQSDLIRTSGTFTGTTSSNLTINGTGNLATALYFTTGSENLGNLTINRSSSGTATIATDLTVSSSLAMTAGELDLNDKTLTLNGTVSGTGTLKGSANSSIAIGGSGSLGTIYFSSGAQELENLTTNRSSGISTLGTDLTVNNTLTLTDGIISTGSKNLIVTNTTTGSVTGQSTSSYINGNLRRYVLSSGSYDFPVGTDSQYEIANINLITSSGITYFDSKFTNPAGTTDISSLGLSINGTAVTTLLDYGYWTITPDALTSIKYDVTIISQGHSNGGTTANQHTVVKRENSSSDWNVYESNHDNSTQSGSGTSAITAKLTGLTSFSDFAIARSDINPLPITLLSFDAKPNKKFIELNWVTQSEINNDYFTIEKSYDGIMFFEVLTIDGSGTTNKLNSYSAQDYELQGQTIYYRLKQTDFDGNFSYSNIISVYLRISNLDILFYDNFLSFKLDDDLQNHIRIVDELGRIYFDKNISNQEKLKLDISNFEKGIYFVSCQNKQEIVTKKIVIIK